MKKILEIGHGGLLLGSTLEYFIDHKPQNIQYHGIDLPPNQTHSIEELFWPIPKEDTISYRITKLKTEIETQNPPDIFLYEMDARQLTFAPETFDEVHLHYIVTQPDIEKTDTELMIKEAYRVLKHQSSIIITGEKSGNMFKAKDEGYNITSHTLRTLKFSTISESRETLQSATIFYDTIKKLLECRTQEEGSFMIIGIK